MSFRVLVVDDEPLARLGVVARLARHHDVTLVGECATAEEALPTMISLSPDLVFLDIQMPGLSGLEMLHSLPFARRPAVIFLTAYDQYAVEAFAVQALDYLLKPVDDERFEVSLERARHLFELKRQEAEYGQQTELLHSSPESQLHIVERFAVRSGRKVTLISASDVEWIEALGDYAGLHVGEKTHLIRETLSCLTEKLDRSRFLRVHRSAIVRIDLIHHLQTLANGDSLITLTNGCTVRSSRTYNRELRELKQIKAAPEPRSR